MSRTSLAVLSPCLMPAPAALFAGETAPLPQQAQTIQPYYARQATR